MNNALNTIKEVRENLSGNSPVWPEGRDRVGVRIWADQYVLDQMIWIVKNGIQNGLSVEEIQAAFQDKRDITASGARYSETEAWDFYVELFNSTVSEEVPVA